MGAQAKIYEPSKGECPNSSPSLSGLHFCARQVHGTHITWRINQLVLPFLKVFGHWADEHVLALEGQLSNMAEEVAQKIYEELASQPVEEDYSGDGSEEAEYARDLGVSYYENVSAMYQTTVNLFAAGLFHSTEQQLADLTRDGAIEFDLPDARLQFRWGELAGRAGPGFCIWLWHPWFAAALRRHCANRGPPVPKRTPVGRRSGKGTPPLHALRPAAPPNLLPN